MSQFHPFADYTTDKEKAYEWALLIRNNKELAPYKGLYIDSFRTDGHLLLEYQPDQRLIDLGFQSEHVPIPEPRLQPPTDAGDVEQMWPTEYGPLAVNARNLAGVTRLGEQTRLLWSFLYHGHKGAVILRCERLGDGLAYIFEGPEQQRLIRPRERPRLRKANPDECQKQSTAWYNNARNASLRGLIEVWRLPIPNDRESYFIIQISPVAYTMDGGIHDLLENAFTDPKGRGLDNVAAWRRDGEPETVPYEVLADHRHHYTADVTVTPEAIEAAAEVTPAEAEALGSEPPQQNPINTVTPLKQYFFVEDDDIDGLVRTVMFRIPGDTNDLRPGIEFLTDEDKYAIYEYATKDQYPDSEGWNDWRTQKSKLHRTHLEAGKEISLTEKVLQAIAILPEERRAIIDMDICEIFSSIIDFNLTIRSRHYFTVDIESPA